LLKFEEILESQGIPVLKWIGGQADNERKDILVKFNSVQNMYGKLFKVILLSSAGSEGISLKNVRQVHIMEPHWNEIRIQQIIGRAIRVCSHAKLPKEERHVDIYRYICKKSSGETADEIVYNVSMRKFKYDKAIQDLVKASALDCELNLERNVDVTACK
jgi:SNF2 family DNA or RNA helicase